MPLGCLRSKVSIKCTIGISLAGRDEKGGGEREKLLLEESDPHGWLPLESKSRDVSISFLFLNYFVYLLVPRGSLNKATTKNAHFYHKSFPHPLIRM